MNLMRKSNNLDNVLKEIEKLTISPDELDEELEELGFSPGSIVNDVEEKIKNLRKLREQGVNSASQEFDPFMIAAGRGKKKPDITAVPEPQMKKDEEK